MQPFRVGLDFRLTLGSKEKLTPFQVASHNILQKVFGVNLFLYSIVCEKNREKNCNNTRIMRCQIFAK